MSGRGAGSGARAPSQADRLTADRREALRFVPVSRETEDRFAIFVDLLARWRRTTNLISKSTFPTVWTRHIADSAQLLPLAEGATRWLDIGSGAGFPGMIVAIQLAGTLGRGRSLRRQRPAPLRLPSRGGASDRRARRHSPGEDRIHRP